MAQGSRSWMARVNFSKPKVQSADMSACSSFRVSSPPVVDMSSFTMALMSSRNFDPFVACIVAGVAGNAVGKASADSVSITSMRLRNVGAVVAFMATFSSVIISSSISLFVGFIVASVFAVAEIGILSSNELSLLISDS